MPEVETRWPCPVCLGVRMEKRAVGPDGAVVLDHCSRCGGLWLEKGETVALRRLRPADLLPHLTPRDGVHAMRCRRCEGMVPRDAEACPACGAAPRIDCPSCDRALESRTVQGLRLDFCRPCQGVWVDHRELASLWHLSAVAVGHRRGHGTDGALQATGDTAASGVGDILFYAPDLVFYGGEAVARAAAGGLANAPELAGAAAEAAGGMVEVAGEVAAYAFGFIVEAICSLF